MHLSTYNSNTSLIKIASGQQTKQTENAQYQNYKALINFNKYSCLSFP